MKSKNYQGIYYAKDYGLIPGDWDEWCNEEKTRFGKEYYIEIPRHNAQIIQSLLDKAVDRPPMSEDNPEGITTVVLPPGIFCFGADVRKRGQVCLFINYDYTRLTGSGTAGELGSTPLSEGGTIIKTPFRFNEGVKGDYRAAALRIKGTDFGNRQPRHHIYLDNFEVDGGGDWTGYYEWDTHNKRDKDYGWDITHHGINVSVDDQVDFIIISNLIVRNFRGEMLYIGGHNTGYLEVTRCIVGGTNASCNNLDGHTLYCHNNQWGLKEDNSRFWMEYSPRRCLVDVYEHQPLPDYVPQELKDAVATGQSTSYFSNNIYINSDYTQASCIAVAQAMNDDTFMYFVNNTFDNSDVANNYAKKGIPMPEGCHSIFQIAGGSAGGSGKIVIRGNKIINHPGTFYDHFFGGATGEGIWFIRSGNVLIENNTAEKIGAKGHGLISLTGSWAPYPMYADNILIKNNSFTAAETGVISVMLGGKNDIVEGPFHLAWMGENGTDFVASQPIKETNVNNYDSGEIVYGQCIALGNNIEITDNAFVNCEKPEVNKFMGTLPVTDGNNFM